MTEILPAEERDELRDEIEAVVRKAMRRPLSREPWFWCLIAAAVVAAWLYFSLRADNSDLSQTATSAQTNAATANGAVAALASQVRQLGGTPVATPSPQSGRQGSRGPGPTAFEIQSAVDLYCAEHNDCTGTPSRGQVRAAVTAFCAAGACTGKHGATGSPGPSGASGQPGQQGAQGAQGAGPTDTQVAAAVGAFCAAHGGCTGPAGPKGDTGSTGASGAPGRGIASIDCTGLGVDQLTITYDDGSTQTVPCNATTPTLTVTPSGAPTT